VGGVVPAGVVAGGVVPAGVVAGAVVPAGGAPAAGLVAGTVNAIVGSGSLLTFPVLLAAGYSPVVANVTNTVGIVFGTFSGVVGYRRELSGQRQRVLLARALRYAGRAAAELPRVVKRSPAATDRRGNAKRIEQGGAEQQRELSDAGYGTAGASNQPSDSLPSSAGASYLTWPRVGVKT